MVRQVKHLEFLATMKPNSCCYLSCQREKGGEWGSSQREKIKTKRKEKRNPGKA